MTAFTSTPAEIAAEIVVCDTYDELRTLLANSSQRGLLVIAHLHKHFPAHAAAHAAKEFTTADLLDALDDA